MIITSCVRCIEGNLPSSVGFVVIRSIFVFFGTISVYLILECCEGTYLEKMRAQFSDCAFSGRR
jgi:hypothetical protein